MNLDKFIQAELERIRRFSDHWKTSHINDAEAYPNDLPMPDWIEQLQMWED